jgi:hypothetical protein
LVGDIHGAKRAMKRMVEKTASEKRANRLSEKSAQNFFKPDAGTAVACGFASVTLLTILLL